MDASRQQIKVRTCIAM